jgi:hypothetical protein
MNKHIGLRRRGVPTIAEMLYFDTIVIVSRPPGENDEAILVQMLAEKKIPIRRPVRIGRKAEDLHQRTCIDYLASQGVVADISAFLDARPVLTTFKAEQEQSEALLMEALRVVYSEPEPTANQFETNNAKSAPSVEDIATRIDHLVVKPYRQAIQANPDCSVTSILSDHPSAQDNASDDPVLNIVIGRLPIPAPDTPFEAVLEFRSDPEAMRALRRLRHWMAGIARSGLSSQDIEGELNDLLDRYTEYMNLHKLKYYNGTFESLMSVSLDVLENLTRLKFKTAFDSLFSLRARTLALTEAELKAPGREAAYISRAEDALSQWLINKA